MGGNSIIGNANTAVRRLLDSGVQVRYVTNTTKESTEFISNRCRDLNLFDERIGLHSCIDATVNFLKKNNIKRPLLLIENETMSNFNEFECHDSSLMYDSIVVGYSPSKLNYQFINTAYQLLCSNRNVTLVAMHKGQKLETSKG